MSLLSTELTSTHDLVSRLASGCALIHLRSDPLSQSKGIQAVHFASIQFRELFTALLIAATIAFAPSQASAADSEAAIANHSRNLLFGSPLEFQTSLAALNARGQTDVTAIMILALRYRDNGTSELTASLAALTGHAAGNWFDWMVWQEQHSEPAPHSSYADIKLELFQRIDPEFQRFFPDAETLEEMRIDFTEVTWGGVRVDGIPSLDNPELISGPQASYLQDEDLVFGVEINGDTRAYPLRIMGWHEMFNETIGGVPVVLAYCTLCGSGILFETEVEGRAEPFVFGSSGLLYRSNKLMFDRETNSLWNQFTGRPVSGPLVGSTIELKIRPVAITSWANWYTAHPDTRVLSHETGHRRNYGSGVVYRDYFASPDLMFPTVVDETLFKQKSYVFGIRNVAASKAWPISAFAGGAIINDRVGARPVVLIGDAATRTVRAYDRGDREFSATEDPRSLASDGASWRIGEEALVGPDGTTLARIPGHIAYWFAWNGYLGTESEIYRVGE